MVILAHPSAARTATGQTGAVRLGEQEAVALFVGVTAASGTTPTLVVKVQESPDGTTWYDVTSFNTASLTAVSNERVAVPTVGRKFADYVRLVYTIGGTTPSFTFTAHLATVDLSSSN